MKKKNFNSKLSLKKSQIADLNLTNLTGGAVWTLQKNCVSHPYRCSIEECQLTDITCYDTQTCEPLALVTDPAIC
jgi:hypothetical protein